VGFSAEHIAFRVCIGRAPPEASAGAVLAEAGEFKGPLEVSGVSTGARTAPLYQIALKSSTWEITLTEGIQCAPDVHNGPLLGATTSFPVVEN
jgi:hypothetical protein